MLTTGLIIAPPSSEAVGVKAFPGAEGYGSDSIGGRGGTVIHVTTLASSGAGSFREAVTTSGARHIIFDVSGIIDLTTTDITISNPYMTIAGQTSPGGILITGRRIKINTHDVTIQHVRFRIGSHGGVDPEKSRSLEIHGDSQTYPNAAYNVIIDHCSLAWAADQIMSIDEDCYDITLSWCLFSEGLDRAGHPDGGHSYGPLFWGKYTNNDRIYTYHHNYTVHCGGRNPEINFNGVLDAVNNVAYNYTGGKSPKTAGEAKASWIHNYTKPGNQSNPANLHYEVRHDLGGTVAENIYSLGNLGVQRDDQSDDEWEVGTSWTSTILPETWRSFDPIVTSKVTATTMSYEYAEQILTTVGATFPVRDTVDQQMVDDFDAGTGDIINNVTYPGDYPTFSTPSGPTDTNSDGIPDGYETFKGYTIGTMNPTDSAPSGYDWIEEYWYDLVSGNYVP